MRISASGGAAAPSADAVRAQAYPLARRLFFYVRTDRPDNMFARQFVAHATSPDAFDRIDELGFVAIRPESVANTRATRQMGCRLGAPESAALMSALRNAERQSTVLRFREGTVQLDDAALADVARMSEDMIAQITHGNQIMLVGHSDIAGSTEDNRALGLQRALVARAEFEARGVYGLQVESAGEVCPVADMETEAGRRANRRVEVWIRQAAD